MYNDNTASENVDRSVIHTPSSIYNVFEEQLIKVNNSNCYNKEMLLRGLYKLNENAKPYQKDQRYSECYYDRLYDIENHQYITLIIPEYIRNEMSDKNNYIVTLMGILKVESDYYTGFKIIFTVKKFITSELSMDELDKQKKILDIITTKIKKGFINIDQIIYKKLKENEEVKIYLICGYSSIIKKDIMNALGRKNPYKIEYPENINLSDKEDLIKHLTALKNNKDYDIIVLARGGGDGIDIFDDIDIAKAIFDLNIPFVTAIGHAVDTTFIDKIADKVCDTPTALGNYLKDTYTKSSWKLKRNYKTITEEETKSDLNSIKSDIAYMKNELESSQRKSRKKNKYKRIIILSTISLISSLIITYCLMKHIITTNTYNTIPANEKKELVELFKNPFIFYKNIFHDKNIAKVVINLVSFEFFIICLILNKIFKSK